MSFKTILILIIIVALMIYFKIKKIKYTNTSVYNQKNERLNEIIILISCAETENEKIDKLIISTDFTKKLKNSVIKKFILYSDNLKKLKYLGNEQKEIERYLRIANSYKNDFLSCFTRSMWEYHVRLY